VKSPPTWSIAVAAFFAFYSVTYANTRIPSKLECSALSHRPMEHGPFTASLPFTLSGNTFRGERIPGHQRPGAESYTGTISSNQLIRISGHGAYFDRIGDKWHYHFSGSIKEGALTSVKGSLDTERGGHRDCSIAFLIPSSQLAAIAASVADRPETKATAAKPAMGTADGSDLLKDDHQPNKQPSDLASTTPAPIAVAAPAVTPSQTSPIGRRLGLVIGNSAYASVGKLPNPVRDADAVAASLRSAGFAVVTVKNDLSRFAMISALNDFADQAANADWAVIYFSGHGLEVDGTNYVVPVDAKLLADRDVGDQAISLDRLLKATLGARKLRLVILDACRDDPFLSNMKRTMASRSIGRGLARVEPEGGTLVVYAAKDGQIAYDGDGQNSPFVTALTKRIAEPNIEINMLFRQVRNDVLVATGRKQEPYVYGSLPPESFYFVQR
jgi:Caspase domain